MDVLTFLGVLVTVAGAMVMSVTGQRSYTRSARLSMVNEKLEQMEARNESLREYIKSGRAAQSSESPDWEMLSRRDPSALSDTELDGVLDYLAKNKGLTTEIEP